MPSTTCSKEYPQLPFAHRQPNHTGHCRLVHGHGWVFKFTFTAESLDSCGFVYDFGKLKWLKAWLEDNFDHTLVLNGDDPQIAYFQDQHIKDLCKLVIVPDCSCEGLARLVFDQTAPRILADTKGRVRLTKVELWEDEKNSTVYEA